MNKQKTYIITGAVGQLGLAMCRWLEKTDPDCKIIGIVKPSQKRRARNLSKKMKNFSFSTVDLKNKVFLKDLVFSHKPYAILHFAACTSVWESQARPYETVSNNIVPTLNILDTAREFSPDTHLLFCGSSESKLLNNVYGVSKHCSEALCDTYRKNFSLNVYTLVLYNFFSEFQKTSFFAGKILDYVSEGNFDKKLSVGNLNFFREWTYVDDVCGAIQVVLDSEKPDNYEVSSGHYMTAGGFGEAVFSFVGENFYEHIKVKEDLQRKNDSVIIQSDCKKIKKLGWNPNFSMQEAIKKILEYKNYERNIRFLIR